MNSPKEISKLYADIGAKKTMISIDRLIVLSIFAGMFIAMGAFGSQVVAATVENASIAKMLSSIVFPVGLIMVVLTGAELFTGNNLLIISYLEGKTKLKGVIYNLAIVYVFNFVGGVLIALLLAFSGLFEGCDGELVDLVTRTTQAKVNLTFVEAFLRGIPCNMLVTLAILLGFASKDVTGKILGLFLPTMLFVVSGFEHSVANMYFIFAGIFANLKCGVCLEGVNARSIFINNLLPVTLGNIVGGMLIVGLGYWYAHRSEKIKS